MFLEAPLEDTQYRRDQRFRVMWCAKKHNQNQSFKALPLAVQVR